MSLLVDGAPQKFFIPGVPASTYPDGVIPAGGVTQGAALSLTEGPHTIQITAKVEWSKCVLRISEGRR